MRPSAVGTRPFVVWAIISVVIAAGAVLYGLSEGISWAGLRLTPCYPGCFCEAFRPGAIVQPQSSYSNLWYLLAGLGILASAGLSIAGDHPRTNLLIRQPAYIIAYGIVVIFIGVTSFFYHVSLTLVGRWADYTGMYAFACFAVAYNLARLRIVKGRWFPITFVALLLSLTIPMVMISSLVVKRALLLGMLLAMLGLEGIIHIFRRPPTLRYFYLFSGLGIMLAATGINLLDESGAWCRPTSLWQWHAVWHFLTAAAICLLFLYYRTEDDGAAPPTV